MQINQLAPLGDLDIRNGASRKRVAMCKGNKGLGISLQFNGIFKF